MTASIALSWFGKFTLGTLGLILGGPLGAIAGAALGHILIDKTSDLVEQTIRPEQRPQFEYAEKTQATYFISLFSILGKLSKIILIRFIIAVFVRHAANSVHAREYLFLEGLLVKR